MENNTQSVFDKHFALKCPNCNVQSNISAVAIPRFELLARFQPEKTGVTYRCDSCNLPIFLKFDIAEYMLNQGRIYLSPEYEVIERAKQSFEFSYLPDELASDFREALTCYSEGCFNAFAAMCRRCVQTAATELGADGKDKVLNQLRDLRDMEAVDNETFDLLKQIIIDGHDGAHPHLPKVSEERASIMLALMKDVLSQLFVRKAKIQEAMNLRKDAIKSNA
jgi:hypothetical protein